MVVSHLVGIFSNTGIHKWNDGVTDVPTKVMFDFAGGNIFSGKFKNDSPFTYAANMKITTGVIEG